MIGCDAAVIDKETGKPHCRRMDRHIRAVAVSGIFIRGGFPHRLHSTVMTFWPEKWRSAGCAVADPGRRGPVGLCGGWYEPGGLGGARFARVWVGRGGKGDFEVAELADVLGDLPAFQDRC